MDTEREIIVLKIYIVGIKNKTTETNERTKKHPLCLFRADKSLWLCVNYSTGSGPSGNLSIIKLQ